MRGTDRQIIAFALGVLTTLAATLALGADAPLASYAGGGALCLIALAGGGQTGMPPPFWAGLCVVGYALARTALAGNWWLAGPELAAMAGIAGAFAIGVSAGAEASRARAAAAVLTVSLAGLAALAFAAHVASPDAVFGRPKPFHAGRLTGTFLSANTAATLAALGLVLGLAGVARAVRGTHGALSGIEGVGRRGLASAVLTLFAAACLLLTGSRGGLLAGLVGAFIVVSPGRAGRGARPWAILAFAGVVTVAAAASGGVLGARLDKVGTDGSGRGALWSASLDAWREAPFLGHGFGAYPRALGQHVTAETADLSVQGAAHDVVLQWLVQAGVVGTVLGAVALVVLARTLTLGLRRRRGRWIVRAALGALAVFAVHGLVDYAFEVPAATWWLALLCGLGAGVARGEGGRLTERRRRPRPPGGRPAPRPAR